MKTRVLIIALAVAFTSFANAQAKPQGEKKLELRAMKMANKLKVDDSQKEKFIELYQEYLEDKAACRPQLVIGKELTDKQVKSNLEEMMSVRKKSLKIDKKYYKKLAKVLNAKQLDMIFGFKAQKEKNRKDMKAMPPRRFGKPSVPQGKRYMPDMFKKGDDCKKDCRMKDACKKGPKADKCKKNADCKKECKKKADCKRECKK